MAHFTELQPNQEPTLGTKGPGVLALQQSLNKQFAGVK